jgi:hypothetical protein
VKKEEEILGIKNNPKKKNPKKKAETNRKLKTVEGKRTQDEQLWTTPLRAKHTGTGTHIKKW